MFEITLKLEYIGPAIKLAEEDVMEWKTTVAVLKLGKQKACIKSNQKKAKWVSKEEINKWYDEKWCICCRSSDYFFKTYLYLFIKRPVQTVATIEKNRQLRIKKLEKSKDLKN